MESVIKNITINSDVKIKNDVYVKNKVKFLTPVFWTTAEEMRFGIVPAILTVVVCLSGIAAAFAAESGLTQLILVGAPTALFITTIISVAPMRSIFTLAIVTAMVDIIMFFI